MLLVAGCAERFRWENRNVDQSVWAQDQSFCRRDSESRASKEQDREMGRSAVIGRESSYRSDMIRYEASRYALRLYEACLRTRGYQKVVTER